MENRAGNGANITKRQNYKNQIIVKSDYKANSLERSVFLDEVIVEALDSRNIAANNKEQIKQDTNYKDSDVI